MHLNPLHGTILRRGKVANFTLTETTYPTRLKLAPLRSDPRRIKLLSETNNPLALRQTSVT
jgi:hypothetical protein